MTLPHSHDLFVDDARSRARAQIRARSEVEHRWEREEAGVGPALSSGPIVSRRLKCASGPGVPMSGRKRCASVTPFSWEVAVENCVARCVERATSVYQKLLRMQSQGKINTLKAVT